MKIYKITKEYRNASDVYYIELNDNEEFTKSMAESIGENTNGGHNYGYTIKNEMVNDIPVDGKVLPRTREIRIF